MTLKDALKNPFIFGLLFFLWLAVLSLGILNPTKCFLTDSNFISFTFIRGFIYYIFIILFGSIIAALSDQSLPFFTRVQACFIGEGILQLVKYVMFHEYYHIDTVQADPSSFAYHSILGFIVIFASSVILATALTFIGEKLYFKLKK